MQSMTSFKPNGARPLSAHNPLRSVRTHRGPAPLTIDTRQRIEFHDLTAQIEALVEAAGVRRGTVSIRSMHTTTAVFLNEWQGALLADYRGLVEMLVPDHVPWRHNDPKHSDCERGNAAAHLRAVLLGPSVTLPIRAGRLRRGTWQSVIFAELDGPRERTIGIEILEETNPPEQESAVGSPELEGGTRR